LWVPDMQKIEIFWGSAPDPTGELTALLPSWWEGTGGCWQPPPPKPHSLLSAIRVSSFGHFGAHTPWEIFLDKSPLGLCLLGLQCYREMELGSAIGRRHTESQHCPVCPTPDDVLSVFLLRKPDNNLTSFCSIV